MLLEVTMLHGREMGEKRKGQKLVQAREKRKLFFTANGGLKCKNQTSREDE